MYPSTPIMASTAISLLKEPGFLVEMADSRVGAGNIPDGSETFCFARKQGGPLPVMSKGLRSNPEKAPLVKGPLIFKSMSLY